MNRSYMMQGHFKDDMLEGEGSRTFSSGKSLTGTWSKNQLIVGKMDNPDGTMYEGEFLGGRPHGNGAKVIGAGKRYEGMFSVGRPWGRGTKVLDGRRIEGHWDRTTFVEGVATERKINEFDR